MTDTTWTLFHGGQVLDPEAGKVHRADLLIRDDRIHTVGANLDTEALIPRGEDLNRIDATGKTLMPGFVMVHASMQLFLRWQSMGQSFRYDASAPSRCAWIP